MRGRLDAREFAPGTALLFGDDAEGIDHALAAIEDAGLRVRIVDQISSAHLALEDELAELIVLELGATPLGALDDLLARISAYSSATGAPIIASAPLEQIDHVAGYLWPGTAQLLCEPSSEHRRAAIELALSSRSVRALNDSSTSRFDELELLRRDVARIAERVENLKREAPLSSEPSMHSDSSRKSRLDEVRKRIRARRLRDKFFDSRLFADPAWDILLDLYHAHLEHRDVSVSSLCIAAATPPTTALRWIGTMTDADLLVRQAHRGDRRRHNISLSQHALDAIDQYFAAVGSANVGRRS